MSSGAVETILLVFFCRVLEERVEKYSTQDVIVLIYIYSVYLCIYIMSNIHYLHMI